MRNNDATIEENPGGPPGSNSTLQEWVRDHVLGNHALEDYVVALKTQGARESLLRRIDADADIRIPEAGKMLASADDEALGDDEIENILLEVRKITYADRSGTTRDRIIDLLAESLNTENSASKAQPASENENDRIRSGDDTQARPARQQQALNAPDYLDETEIRAFALTPSQDHDGGSIRLPEVLPPPPKGGDALQLESWVRGRAWNDAIINMEMTDPREDVIEDMMDLETDLESQYRQMCENGRIRSPQALPDPGGGSSHSDIAGLASACDSVEDDAPDKAMIRFETALLIAMKTFVPDQHAFIHANRGRIVAGEAAKKAIYQAEMVESKLLSRFGREPDDADSPENLHDMRSTITDDVALGPGIAIRRAAFLHMIAGRPLHDALFDGLLELRLAQLDREIRSRPETLAGEGANSAGMVTFDIKKCEKLFRDDALAPAMDYLEQAIPETPATTSPSCETEAKTENEVARDGKVDAPTAG